MALTTYTVSVKHGRKISTFTVEAAQPILACEAAERIAAAQHGGCLSRFFAFRVREAVA